MLYLKRFLGLWGLLAALSASAAEPEASKRLVGVADQHIIPTYQALAQAGEALDTAAETLCLKPDPANLNQLQDAFTQAMATWQGVQHIHFGPVELFLRYNRYQMWPDTRGSVSKHLKRMLLEADLERLEPDRFARGSVAVQGFTALERLLFEPGVTSDAFSDDSQTSFRCALVQTISSNISAMSFEVLSEWTEGDSAYRAVLESAPQGNSFFADTWEIDVRLLNALHSQLQLISDFKLRRPLGETLEKARPKRAESWRSQRSLANIRDNLSGTQGLFEAAFAPQISDPEITETIRQAYQQSLAALDKIPLTLAAAVADPDARSLVVALATEIAQLEAAVAGPMAENLELPLGFNSMDGD